MSTRLLDEPINLGKPQARPLAAFFGREERLKRVGNRFGGHPDASIGNENSHVLAGLNFVVHAGVRFVEMRVGGLNGQLASFGHSVASIDGKIYENFLWAVFNFICGPQRGPKPPPPTPLQSELPRRASAASDPTCRLRAC